MTSPDLLVWLREHATPWLDSLMGGITYLGSEYFYITALGILYWCVDLMGTLRLVVLMFVSLYLKTALKELTALPRPFQVIPQLQARFTETAEDYAFPSGHAQDSVVFWGYLAMVFRKRWLTISALVLIVLISFSRLYLGLHWLRDIVGGLLLGALMLGCGYVFLRLLAGMPLQVRFPATLLLGLVPLALFLIYPAPGSAQSMGALFGVALGHNLERRYVRFAVRRPAGQQVLKVIIGLAGALLLLVGLRALFAPLAASPQAAGEVGEVSSVGFLSGRGEEVLRFLRYALVTLWVSLGAPALFRVLFGRDGDNG